MTITTAIIKRRFSFSIISILLIVFCGLGASKTHLNTDYKVFFDPSDTRLQQHELIEAEFSPADNLSVLIETTKDSLFNQKDLQAIRDITDESWTLPYSIRVDSLTNYQYSQAEEDELIVEDYVSEEDITQFTTEQFEQLRHHAVARIELANYVLSADAKVTSVTVTLAMPSDIQLKNEAAFEAMQAARELIKRYKSKHPTLNFYLAGQTTTNATFNELSQRDTQLLFPIMFAAIILLLLFLLRSISGTAITVALIVGSITVTLGTMGWLAIPLDQVTAALPIVILTLVVCNCVHILKSYYFELGKMSSTPQTIGQQEKAQALTTAIKTNLKPVFITSLTTAIGFLSLNYSESPPLRALGTWAAFGVSIAFVFCFSLLPYLAILLTKKHSSKTAKFSDFSQYYRNRLLAHRNLIGIALVLGCGYLISKIPDNELNDNTLHYFSESIDFRKAGDFLQERLSGFDSFAYALRCGDKNCVNEPAFLQKVDAFSQWLNDQPEIVHVVSYSNVIKRLNENMHGGDKQHYRVPEQRDLAAQYQLLYELSLPFGLDLNNQVDLDKSALRVSAIIRNQDAKGMLALEQRISEWFDNHAPELKSSATGVSIMFAHLGMANIKSMVAGSLLALLFITITLMIAMRSVRYGLISLIPNGLPAACAFGIWSLFVGEVNFAVAVVFSFTLGIIVDDTVHFLNKYIYAKRELLKNTADAIEYALSTVGGAIIVTTVVLASGFAVLAFSDFNVNAYLGQMVAITIVLALILDTTLLPLVLYWLDRSKTPSRSG